ncbi:sodium/hydrogen exchanger family protein [Rhizobium sp. PP-F2F-G20b]|nr:sodium/hydrogen exchanger family protein [Rhizobium sp. PP-F2F-G20b]
MVGVDLAFLSWHLFENLTNRLRQIDFTTIVMDGVLAFLLFAGALHVDLGRLRSRAVPVLLLAFVGTVISTGIVGAGTWLAAHLLGLPISLL